MELFKRAFYVKFVKMINEQKRMDTTYYIVFACNTLYLSLSLSFTKNLVQIIVSTFSYNFWLRKQPNNS